MWVTREVITREVSPGLQGANRFSTAIDIDWQRQPRRILRRIDPQHYFAEPKGAVVFTAL